jgi:hypothetical protein
MNLRRTALAWAALAASAAFGWSTTAGAGCIGTPIDREIRTSELIFIGTVGTTRSFPVGRTAHTHFVFQQIRYLKRPAILPEGATDSTVTVTQVGGISGRFEVVVAGAPRFETDVRYVVFARFFEGFGISASECGIGSKFVIRSDSSGAEPIAYFRDARIVHLDERYMVLASNRSRSRPAIAWPLDAEGRRVSSNAPPPERRPTLSEILGRAERERVRDLESGLYPGDAASADRLRIVWLHREEDPGGAIEEEAVARQLHELIAKLGGVKEPESPLR